MRDVAQDFLLGLASRHPLDVQAHITALARLPLEHDWLPPAAKLALLEKVRRVQVLLPTPDLVECVDLLQAVLLGEFGGLGETGARLLEVLPRDGKELD